MAADNIWRPPNGLTISAACCSPSWVVAYYGGRSDGRLAALQYARARSPVKRKRGNQEEWRLMQVADLSLAGDPSCMDIRTTEDGFSFHPFLHYFGPLKF